MFDLSHLRIWIGATAVSMAAIACAPPELTNAKSEPEMKAKVSSALSSSQSQSNLGIARWHSTVLAGTDGRKAGTFDGQDSKGKVKFLATIREDKKTSTVHIQSIFPKKGEWVFDAKSQKVVRNTIPAKTMTLVTAFSSDWRATHPEQTTSTHAGFRANPKLPTSSQVDSDDPVVDAGNYWLIYYGHKYGYITDSKYDAYNDLEHYDPKNYDANGKRIEPSTDKPADNTTAKTTEETPAATTEETPAAKTTEETPAATTEETPAAKTTEETPAPTTEETPAPTTEETPAPTTEETPAATPEETPADDLPKDNGANLDQLPEQDTETVGNDFGDVNAPIGGEDTGFAIIAKHPKNTTPNTPCKTAATSKSTGIRACLHY